jgi:predicted kinase
VTLIVPDPSLVVLIGPSGSGKSTFARRHFRASEVLSSDYCRYLVCDDENNQAATNDAFEVLHCITAKRLAACRLTVIDATNVQASARERLLALARRHAVSTVAIILNVTESVCLERNQTRPDRTLLPDVIRDQHQELQGGITGLEQQGFRHIYTLNGPDEIDSAQIERRPPC